jgi:hypothetical protein
MFAIILVHAVMLLSNIPTDPNLLFQIPYALGFIPDVLYHVTKINTVESMV